jgi:hypothetical protein
MAWEASCRRDDDRNRTVSAAPHPRAARPSGLRAVAGAASATSAAAGVHTAEASAASASRPPRPGRGMSPER